MNIISKILFFVFILFFSVSSYAQSEKEDEEEEIEEEEASQTSAEDYINEAKQLFNAKKYIEAVEPFSKAFKLEPNPMYLFNIGKCYDLSGRYEDAVLYYRKFLDTKPEKALVDKAKKTISIAKKEISKTKSELFVESDPIKATVVIKDMKKKKILESQTPFQTFLPFGTYEVFAKIDGSGTIKQRVTILLGIDSYISFAFQKSQSKTSVQTKQESAIPKQSSVNTSSIPTKKHPEHSIPSDEIVRTSSGMNLSIYKWSTLGVGIASIITGIIFSVITESKIDSLNNGLGKTDDSGKIIGITMSQAEDLRDKAESYRTTSYVMYGIGNVALFAAGILFFLDIKEGGKKEEIQVFPIQPQVSRSGVFINFKL